MLGKIEGRRRRGQQAVRERHRLTGYELEHTAERVEDGGTWHAAVRGF